MSQQSSGMRFDIYERVHLPEDVPSVREFSEIELVPDIQVDLNGEQAVLKGNLLLAGTYLSDGETRSGQTLEHLIPVEITLPKNRVRSLENVGIDIENFDVDLLSSRSLNVTGVLSLRGVEAMTTNIASPANEASETRDDHDEMVYVYKGLEASNEGNTSNNEVRAEAETPQASENEEVEVEPEVESEKSETSNENPKTLSANEQENDQLSTASSEASQSGALGSEELSEAGEDANINPNVDPGTSMKIAFAAKDTAEMTDNQSLKQLMRSAESVSTTVIEETVAEETDNEEDSNIHAADALEWKKLFISEDTDQVFSQVRMCIVQKEETLESIAERYKLNPNEIRLYNRIDDREVSEGQIIYIPLHA